MIRAIQSAQASFEDFARQAELENFRKEPAFDDIAIKAFFPHPGQAGDGEHLYATFVAWDGQQIEAILDADPYFVPDLREGQRVQFPLEFLSDWILVIQGQGLGGFTLEATLNLLTPEQRLQHQSAPPYHYFRHRQLSAQEELDQIPVCTRCQARDLIAELYSEGLCGPCQLGYQRCTCRQCQGPILRHPSQTQLCARCQHEARQRRVPQPVAPATHPLASAPEHERRSSFRLNRIVGAEILHSEGCIPARLFVIDISLTGFRATCHFELPDSPELYIRIFLEPKAEPVQTEARIVWKNLLATSGNWQFGFEFLDMAEEQAERLDQFIQKERRRSLNAPEKPVPWVTWSPRNPHA